MHSCAFTKHHLARGCQLPETLDLCGCLAIKLDHRKRSLIHRIIMGANKKHLPDLDSAQVHAFVILGRDRGLSQRFKRPVHRLLEFGLPGAFLSYGDLSHLPAGDEVLIYEPRDAALRARICAYSLTAAEKNTLTKLEVLGRLAKACLAGPQPSRGVEAKDLLAFRPRSPDVPWFSHCGGLTTTVLLAALAALNLSMPGSEAWDPRRLYPAQLSALLDRYVTETFVYGLGAK